MATYHLCDGPRHCQDGSDEWNCVRLDNTTRQLEVRYVVLNLCSRWQAIYLNNFHKHSMQALILRGNIVKRDYK